MMFLCSKCPKIFRDKKQLANHQRYHVMVESPCEICQKIFPSKQSMLIHLSTHKSTVFSCGECSKTYKHQASLIAHQRLHYGGITCPFCDKFFLRKEYLKVHLLSCRDSIKGDLNNFENETEILFSPGPT